MRRLVHGSWIALLFFLPGCLATNVTELEKAHARVIEALGNDPATVCVTASYGPATIMGARTNITNGDVKCSPAGLELKSQGTQMGVPMIITPQLSIGQPTLKQPSPPTGVLVNPPKELSK